MKKHHSFLLLLPFFLLFFSCGRSGSKPESPAVLTTVGMLTDITRRVGEGVVEVEGLLGSGVDPHLYKPNSNDVKRIKAAPAVLYAGLHLEGKLQSLFEDQRSQGRHMEAVSPRLPAHLILRDENGQSDPHVWMDVSLWSLAAGEVGALLKEWHPESTARIDENTRALRDELNRLDTYVAHILSSVPENRRVLVTAHDAFGYFGRRYGVEVLGIQGFSTDSEAGLRRLNELVDLIVTRQIPAVFVESTVADKNVRALVEGSADRGHAVRIGGELFSDAMGGEGTAEGTYIGMILHNAETVVRALGGTIPDGGFTAWKAAVHE